MSRLVHVAVVHPCYVGPILSGQKTAELRLTRTRREPWRSLGAGDRVLFRSQGEVFAVARASRVSRFEIPSELTMNGLRRLAEPVVRPGPGFWDLRRDARYAVLIHLAAVTRFEVHKHGPAPVTPRTRSAWHIIEPATPSPTG